MSKKYWNMLYELFSQNDDLREKYSELSNVVDKIIENIKLSEELDKIQKELQELNKED